MALHFFAVSHLAFVYTLISKSFHRHCCLFSFIYDISMSASSPNSSANIFATAFSSCSCSTTVYTENADADYNKKEVVDLKRIDLSKDGVYVQDDKIIEEDFIKAVSENKVQADQKDTVLKNLDIRWNYVVAADKNQQNIWQNVSYYYNGILLGEHPMLLYDSRQVGGTLENLYICFEPNAKNTITVQNKDDYPLNLFLIKQGDQAAKVEVHLVGTKEKEHFGEEQDPDFTKGIRIRANFTDADTPLFYYKGSGSETSLNQSQLEKYFGLSGLDGKRVHTRLYDVTVKVNRENKEITTLTGTVTR